MELPNIGIMDANAWIRLFEQAERTIEDLGADLENAKRRAGGPSGREKRLTSKKLKAVTEDVGQLEDALNSHAHNPARYQLSPKEIDKRRANLQALTTVVRNIQNFVNPNQAGRNALYGNSSVGNATRYQETDYTQSRTNQDLLQSQQQAIAGGQDEQLDMILGGVQKLKELSYDMGQELDLHSHLLDDLDKKVEQTDAKMVTNTMRVDDIRETSSGCGSVICMLILLAIIVMLLISNWPCHIFNKDKC